jgi:hypothetical protein
MIQATLSSVRCENKLTLYGHVGQKTGNWLISIVEY